MKWHYLKGGKKTKQTLEVQTDSIRIPEENNNINIKFNHSSAKVEQNLFLLQKIGG